MQNASETEYQVTFQKGSRVGARSFRTVIVMAADELQAINRATAEFKREYPGERGYRYSSIFS